jgi:uncharacterized membrane protein
LFHSDIRLVWREFVLEGEEKRKWGAVIVVGLRRCTQQQIPFGFAQGRLSALRASE